VVVVDADFQVQSWNRGARELWGLTPDEAVGQHFLKLDVGLPVDQLLSPIRAALTNGDADGAQPLRVQAVNRRGRQIECVVTMTPLDGASDGRQGVIVMMQPAESTHGQ
jgi:two-component system, chemotaxis family, CheB/CheR fusion protein